LQAAVDPLVKMCQHMVDIWPKGTGWEKNVFMTNCGLYLQVCIVRLRRVYTLTRCAARVGIVLFHERETGRASKGYRQLGVCVDGGTRESQLGSAR
jgi:hypothetical protein